MRKFRVKFSYRNPDKNQPYNAHINLWKTGGDVELLNKLNSLKNKNKKTLSNNFSWNSLRALEVMHIGDRLQIQDQVFTGMPDM